MKTLIAADGSSYTKRMLAYLSAHDEWLGPKHDDLVNLVLGSVATKVLAKCSTPVLLVR